MPPVVPIVVALLVAFFCTLLVAHAVLSRGERGMGAFVFAPLGVTGMVFAGLLHGAQAVPTHATSALALVSAPLSMAGFAWEARGLALSRAAFASIAAVVATLAAAVGWFAASSLGFSPEAGQIVLRALLLALPVGLACCHLLARHATPDAAQYSRRFAGTLLGSVGLAALFAAPSVALAPQRAGDPVLWVGLAALTGTWAQVAHGRVSVRLHLPQVVSGLLLFLGVVAIAATTARQLRWNVDLPTVLTAVVATLFVGIGFVALNDVLARQLTRALRPNAAALEAELGRARESLATMQAKWQQLERLALAGQLAATVAHEIKNPLAAVRGYAERLAPLGPLLPDDARARLTRAVAVITEESERMNARVQALLTVARSEPGSATPARFSLGTVLSQAVALVDAAAAIDVQDRCAAQPWVAGNEDALRSAFVNLLRNAQEAGAAVRVRVALSAADGRARVVVEDDGAGMTDEQLAAPVVAFRSTKPSGTGLGLVVAQRGITDCGGALTFERNTPRGTRAVVELPLAEERPHG